MKFVALLLFLFAFYIHAMGQTSSCNEKNCVFHYDNTENDHPNFDINFLNNDNGKRNISNNSADVRATKSQLGRERQTLGLIPGYKNIDSLSISTNSVKNNFNTWSDLSSNYDVDLVKKMLEEQQFAEANCSYLLDQNATPENLDKTFLDLLW